MGTELNLDLARGMGFTVDAGVNDLVIAAARLVGRGARRRRGQRSRRRWRPRRDRPASAAVEQPPRTSASALRREPADLVLVSVPGRYAYAEASDALDAGADVLVFSDNVPVSQEISLKQRAAAAGTARHGPGLRHRRRRRGRARLRERRASAARWASSRRPGRARSNCSACSTTPGVGVSACLGVGGRDLSSEVGGLSTIAALDRLDADPATTHIVVVSKPPAAEVAERVRAHAASLTTPVRFALLGAGQPDLTARRARRCSPDLGSRAATRSVAGVDRLAATRRDRARCAASTPAARCATRRC